MPPDGRPGPPLFPTLEMVRIKKPSLFLSLSWNGVEREKKERRKEISSKIIIREDCRTGLFPFSPRPQFTSISCLGAACAAQYLFIFTLHSHGKNAREKVRSSLDGYLQPLMELRRYVYLEITHYTRDPSAVILILLLHCRWLPTGAKRCQYNGCARSRWVFCWILPKPIVPKRIRLVPNHIEIFAYDIRGSILSATTGFFLVLHSAAGAT